MGDFLLGVIVASMFFAIGVFAAGVYGVYELKKEMKNLKNQREN